MNNRPWKLNLYFTVVQLPFLGRVSTQGREREIQRTSELSIRFAALQSKQLCNHTRKMQKVDIRDWQGIRTRGRSRACLALFEFRYYTLLKRDEKIIFVAPL